MDIPRGLKHRNPDFDWDLFLLHVKSCYEDLSNPKYFFTKQFFESQKYPLAFQFIDDNYSYTDDTEPNTDVSYGFVLKKQQAISVLRLSFVGPYFFLSSLPSVELENEELLFETWGPLLFHLKKMGFQFTSNKILQEKIMFNKKLTTIKSILYCFD